MKIHKIPQTIQTLIFDIDSTLYTNSAYAYEQVDCQVREFAKLKNLTSDEARKLVFDFRKKFAEENGGKKISLGNLLTNFGIPIEQSVKWRNDLMRPEDFLVRDEKLICELQILSKKYKLICVTNNPVKPARKTLEVIGISDFFEHIVGLDTCYKSKPAREPFEKALELTKTTAENAVAIGDRYDLDIELPLRMGMGGIEVSGVEDVYDLNKILG
jgi:phosphoglycolate phosphatase/putative hydrolase of the HAD superfamily